MKETLISLALFLPCLSSPALGYRSEATWEVLDILRDSSYDNVVPPFNSNGDPTDVEIQVFLRHLKVDDLNMQIKVDMTLRTVWKDARLAYSTPGVPYVTISEPKLAWLPDPFVRNAESTEQQVTVSPENFLRITPDGVLTYSTRIITVIRCLMDQTSFPFDEQQCSLDIASYGYTDDEVHFIWRGKTTGVTENKGFMSSNTLRLVNFTTEHNSRKTSTGSYSSVTVTFSLTRQLKFFITNFYIPVLMMVILAFMSEAIARTEIQTRVLLTLVPLISAMWFFVVFSHTATAPWSGDRSLDVFSGVSLIAIFCQLLRVVFMHFFAMRSIKNEDGEDLPRKFQTGRVGKIFENASLISMIVLVVFYVIFFIVYFVAN